MNKINVDSIYDGVLEKQNDWHLHFQIDIKSPYYKSIYFGWFVLVWCWDDFDKSLNLSFTPTDTSILEWVIYRDL